MDTGSPATIAVVFTPSVLAILAGAGALSAILARPARRRGLGLAIAGVTLGGVTLALNGIALWFVHDLVGARAAGRESVAGGLDGYVAPADSARPMPGETPARTAFNEGLRLREQDPQLALQHLSDALSYEPNFDAALRERGKLRMQTHDLPGAIRDFTDLVTDQPDDPEGFVWRARANRENGDLVAALADWQRYLDLDAAGSSAQEARAAVRAIREQLDGK